MSLTYTPFICGVQSWLCCRISKTMRDGLQSVHHVYERDCGPIKLHTTTTWHQACAPIGSQLPRSKILWMKHVVFWREPDGVIPHGTGDWLTGRWDSRKVLRHHLLLLLRVSTWLCQVAQPLLKWELHYWKILEFFDYSCYFVGSYG